MSSQNYKKNLSCTKCVGCGKPEGIATPMGKFILSTEKHTATGQIFRHGCGCITTANPGTGSPECDKVFRRFSSLEKLVEEFPRIEFI